MPIVTNDNGFLRAVSIHDWVRGQWENISHMWYLLSLVEVLLSNCPRSSSKYMRLAKLLIRQSNDNKWLNRSYTIVDSYFQIIQKVAHYNNHPTTLPRPITRIDDMKDIPAKLNLKPREHCAKNPGVSLCPSFENGGRVAPPGTIAVLLQGISGEKGSWLIRYPDLIRTMYWVSLVGM